MKRVIFTLGILLCYNFAFSQTLNLDSALKKFKGYIVNTNARQLGEDYWLRGTGVQRDLIIQAFQKTNPLNPIQVSQNYIQGAWGASVCGDFNNDGYVDVFTPGTYSSVYSNPTQAVNMSFLIWDSVGKIFKDTSLLNDKSIKTFADASKTIPLYLNNDIYLDLIVFPTDYAATPIKLILSDGKGGYDVQTVSTIPDGFHTSFGQVAGITMTGGDVGDLNGDGLPDIFITAGGTNFIYWGITNPPYFTDINHATFIQDSINFKQFENNGFGISAPLCTPGDDAVIKDINNDGIQDIILCHSEKLDTSQGSWPNVQKVLINKGAGQFLNSSAITLPAFNPKLNTPIGNADYLTDDINGDGLIDLIAVTGQTELGIGFNGWNFSVYYQKPNGTFSIDTTVFKFMTNSKTRFLDGGKSRLFYFDFNGDGKKDVGYIDINWGGEYGPNNIMYNKTVFIREGNYFVEHSLYDFDYYAQYCLKILKKRFLCAPVNMPIVILNNINQLINNILKTNYKN